MEHLNPNIAIHHISNSNNIIKNKSAAGHILGNSCYIKNMLKIHYRIAIAIAADSVKIFESVLDDTQKAIMSLADDVRECEVGKLWLFRYQAWNEEDEIISHILAAMRNMGEENYFYAYLLKYTSRTKKSGKFNALKHFTNLFIPGNKNFFAGINF